MDQLKKFFAAVKKHHFWLLTAFILIASTTGFWLARRSLNDRIASRISSVNSNYNQLDGVLKEVSLHPNATSHQMMDEMIGELSQSVKKTWESQFNRQKSILVWPKGVLLPKSQATVEAFQPIEALTEQIKEKDPLNRQERKVYSDYISIVFPSLAAIIGAEWTADMKKKVANTMGGPPSPTPEEGMGAALARAASAAPPPEKGPTVIWDTASQQKLLSKICPWFDPNNPPTTLEILYTQEDIWVLTGILKIIKATNGDVRENFLAPVKKIAWIRIGQTAMGNAGDIATISAASGAGGAEYNPYGNSMSDSSDSSQQTTSPTQEAIKVVAGDPADMRYVDASMTPIKGDVLRQKMKSNVAENAYEIVAKRIPVRMRLTVDQKHVNRLIAACGDGDGRFVLEVRQVRINTGEAAEGSVQTTAAGATEGGYNPGGGGGYSGAPPPEAPSEEMGQGAMSNYMNGGLTGAAVMPEGKPDVDLEIFGVIYIYNPPDMDKLGIQQVTSETTIDGANGASGANGTGGANEADAAKKPDAPADQARPTNGDAAAAGTKPAADQAAKTSGADANGATEVAAKS